MSTWSQDSFYKWQPKVKSASTSSFSIIEGELRDTAKLPNLDAMNRSIRRPSIFVDDSFDTTSFQGGKFGGSHGGSHKKTHGSNTASVSARSVTSSPNHASYSEMAGDEQAYQDPRIRKYFVSDICAGFGGMARTTNSGLSASPIRMPAPERVALGPEFYSNYPNTPSIDLPPRSRADLREHDIWAPYGVYLGYQGRGDMSNLAYNSVFTRYDNEGQKIPNFHTHQGWDSPYQQGVNSISTIHLPDRAAPESIDQYYGKMGSSPAPSRLWTETSEGSQYSGWVDRGYDGRYPWHSTSSVSKNTSHHRDTFLHASYPRENEDNGWEPRDSLLDHHEWNVNSENSAPGSAIQEQIQYLNQRLNEQDEILNHYRQMAAQGGAVSTSNERNVRRDLTDLNNKVDYLRRSILYNSASADDRYKALRNPIALQTAGGMLPISALSSPATSSNNHGTDLATARVEMHMAQMSRDIIKVKAFNKFQRMQEDSDRLARIEAKLSSPKASNDNRIDSLIQNMTREMDKLAAQVSKLKEFSRDGTPKTDIQSQVQAVEEQIEELRHYTHVQTDVYHQNAGHVDTKLDRITMALEKRLNESDPMQTKSDSRAGKNSGWGTAPSHLSDYDSDIAHRKNRDTGWGATSSPVESLDGWGWKAGLRSDYSPKEYVINGWGHRVPVHANCRTVTDSPVSPAWIQAADRGGWD